MYHDCKIIRCEQEEYFTLEGYSSTQMKEVIGADMDPSALEKQKRPASRAMVIGSAFDTLLLEPGHFDARFEVLGEEDDVPTTKNQFLFCKMMLKGLPGRVAYEKSYKRYSDEKADAMEASMSRYLTVAHMKDKKALHHKEYARIEEMLANALTQKDYPFGNDEDDHQFIITGRYNTLPVKGMFDVANSTGILDVKTIRNIEIAEEQIERFMYDLQLAHYGMLHKALVEGSTERLIFFQESNAPYRHALVDISKACKAREPLVVDVLDIIEEYLTDYDL